MAAVVARVPADGGIRGGEALQSRRDLAFAYGAQLPLRDAAVAALDGVVCQPGARCAALPGHVHHVPDRAAGATTHPGSAALAAWRRLGAHRLASGYPDDGQLCVF